MNQSSVIRVDGICLEPGMIGRGVRQGCLLSPLLILIYIDNMLGEAIEEIQKGIKVGGQVIADVRFADDQAMIASTEMGLQRIMNRLDEASAKYCMKINAEKTKVMKITSGEDEVINIILRGKKIKQVHK